MTLWGATGVKMTTTECSSSATASCRDDLHKRIVSQVEFYLGDSNMPRDKFLREQASKDADGWISVEVIASFQRMRSISSDVQLIKTVLKDAQSEVFEVDTDASNIKRKCPLSETFDVMPRSVYVKGFPQTTSLDDLLSFFSTFTGVQAVRMRRFPKNKEFKGSVFVEFATESDADNFLSSPPTDYSGHPLTILSKLAYFESKNNAGNNKKGNLEGEFEKLASEYTKSCLVKLSGIPAGLSHLDIKKEIGKLLPIEIAFVEQHQDSTTFVRLKEPKAEELVSSINAAEPKLFDASSIIASVPNDDEEASYYRNLAAVMISKKNNDKRKASRPPKSNQSRNKRNKNKREADDAQDSEPEGKQTKVEEAESTEN